MIRPVSHVAALSPYALADLSAPDGKRLISLSQNESLRPPSPHAIDAAAKAMQSGHLYPDPDWRELRTALAELHTIPSEDILCGNGSMELIGCLARTVADEQCAVLAPRHAYPFFQTATQQARARYDIASVDGIDASVDALLAAVRPDTRIVFLDNPGNPTGTRLPRSEVVRLRQQLPGHVLLVVDEAYGEFADHLGEPMFDLVAGGDTVILRTFSKAYGLAGLRVGWGLFPSDLAAQMRKLMNPNNVSMAGQAAASAAVADQAYMHQTCDLTIRARDAFRLRLHDAGFDVPQSFTNFLLIRFENTVRAQRANEFCRREGLFLRPQAGVGLPSCLRLTVGSPDDLDMAANLLKQWLAEERG